jgi:hypothetical protein
MTYIHSLYRAAAFLVLGAATAAQAADEPRLPANPADANASVPDTRYRASLPYRALPQATTSADQNWKGLNQTVGAINSMSLTMGSADTEPAPQAAGKSAVAPPAAAQASAEGASNAHQHHQGMKQ